MGAAANLRYYISYLGLMLKALLAPYNARGAAPNSSPEEDSRNISGEIDEDKMDDSHYYGRVHPSVNKR